MFLFFDLETSGLLKKGLPLDDPSQPWAVSIAADLCDSEGRSIACFHSGIRADGRSITAKSAEIHGIDAKTSGQSGVKEVIALGMLIGLANQAQQVIGHNVEFDKDVVTGLLMRSGRDTANWLRRGIEWQCTMKMAEPFCCIQSEGGSTKWPTLDEACATVAGLTPRIGFHSAWDDVQRCKQLYFALARRGLNEGADGKPYEAPCAENVIAFSPKREVA